MSLILMQRQDQDIFCRCATVQQDYFTKEEKVLNTELGVNIFCILALLLFNKQWLCNNALSIQLQKVLIVSWLSSILMISVQIWSLQFLCKIIVKNKKEAMVDLFWKVLIWTPSPGIEGTKESTGPWVLACLSYEVHLLITIY